MAEDNRCRKYGRLPNQGATNQIIACTDGTGVVRAALAAVIGRHGRQTCVTIQQLGSIEAQRGRTEALPGAP
jgi:hypothetical protein